MPVGQAVMATMRPGLGRGGGLGRGRGGRSGVDYGYRTLDQLDDLGGRAGVAQRFDEVLAHQRPCEAGQQLHVLGAAGVRRGDQEREVGRAVGRTEVDGGRQPGEADGRLVDVRRAAVRDRDAAGESGGGLGLAGHGGADEAGAVGGSSGIGETSGEQADDGLLVAAGVDVDGDEVGGDDGHGYLPLGGD